MNLTPDSASPRQSGWRTVRFGDVVRNVDEAVRDPLTCDRFVGLEHIDPESLRIKRWGLIAEGAVMSSGQGGTNVVSKALVVLCTHQVNGIDRSCPCGYNVHESEVRQDRK